MVRLGVPVASELLVLTFGPGGGILPLFQLERPAPRAVVERPVPLRLPDDADSPFGCFTTGIVKTGLDAVVAGAWGGL